MKRIVFSLGIIITCLSAKSQLANHRFLGSIQMDSQLTDIILDFKKDTVQTIIKETGEVLEVTTYTAKNGMVSFQKVSGRSNCGADDVGKYTFVQKDGDITFTLLEDVCSDRSGALDKSVWKRSK